MVRDAINCVRRRDGRILVGMAVNVYHVERGSGHGYGSRDRDQSRDWCAFAANGIGPRPDGSGRVELRSPFWLQGRHVAATDNQA